MKTRLLILLVIPILVTFSANQNVYGLWLPQSHEELLEKSRLVFVGKITSVNSLEFEQSNSYEVEKDETSQTVVEDYLLTLDEYTVQVEEFLKNPQDADAMTVRQPTVSIPGRVVPHGGFEIGDKALFYVETLDGTNTYSKESFLIPEQCDANSVLLKPRMIGGDLKMIQNGIEKQENFATNLPITFVAQSDMDTLFGASLEYDVSISKQVGNTYNEKVFHEKITANAKSCEWLSVAKWEFVPDTGNYLVNGRIYKENSNLPIGNQFFSVLAESPLKQFKQGTPFHEIKCDKSMQLTQKYDGSPACVRSETYYELIKRNWVSNIIIAIQSRDVTVDPGDALSSYMGKITPTLEDFKSVMSEPYDIDEIFSKFGEPHDDIGSGIHIYVYELNDKTQIWIGYVKDIWYVRHVDSKGNLIEELFAKPPEPQPNAFENGVTEIINPEHESLRYTKTIQIIEDTYLSKNIQEWQGVSRNHMKSEHEKYGDEFYIELGKLLIKNEFQYQMNNLGIENKNDDFEVFNGMMLTSLPPHIQYTAVVLGTDDNYYRMEGTAYANQVSYYSTKQLQFPDVTVPVLMESITNENRLINILPESGNKARQEPSSLIIHADNDNVEFFNDTPQTIRIQDSGSGVIGEEHTLSSVGPKILPYQSAFMSFDEPGLIEWDARNEPSIEEPWWWSTHAGGYIVVLSDDVDNLPLDDKLRMAQAIVHARQDLPVMGSGSGNAQKALTIDLDPAVVQMIPDAKQYYMERIQQVIPFDVTVIIE